MKVRKFVPLVSAICLLSPMAYADDPTVLGDLDALSPEKLTKDQLQQLLPGAKMSRQVPSSGSTHVWTNDPDGTFIVSTNKAAVGGGSLITSTRTATAPGTWNVSDDGKYCVTVQWKTIADEKWCRFVFKTSQGYYASSSDQNKAAKVYRLTINGN